MAKRSREDSPPPSSESASGSSSPTPSSAPSHTTKYVQTTSADNHPSVRAAMKCSLPPHPETLSFPTFADFEVHYAKTHSNRCSECHRNLPTEHFLGLHISENHDPLAEARRARDEKTYRCFVEDCEKICSTPQKRRMHLVDKHRFPKSYDFLIVNTGIDKRSSMLRTRHRRSSSAASRALQRGKEKHSNGNLRSPESSHAEGSMDTEEPPNGGDTSETRIHVKESDMDELTSTMSALKFVPPSVRFGRGGRRGGLSRS
ncbi:MAG: hypothetical protein HETSPECPRED_005096 [Heterodermia speciosa]|uniref:C2H2-type domain-containing protein n=1 Tax=Heterodermia speciosa TaxID=116794 RepID=A0A8H3FH05_9LECA|nr:MAG: hypothetical protein HETSPECPRED_005096 [Heterodermia speciosa]